MSDTLPPRSNYTRGERVSVLASTLFGYWLDFYNILVISFLLTAIQNSLGISLTEAGVITSVTLAASVFGGLLFGWIGDRYGRKTSLLYSFLLFSLGAIASALSWDYSSLLLFRALAGVGIGGEWGVGMTLYNEVWTSKRRGLGSSVIQSMSLIGIATASLLATWSLANVSGSWSWRLPLIVGALPLIALIFIRMYMPESKLWQEYNELRTSGQLPVEKSKQAIPLFELFRGAVARQTILSLIMLCGYMFAFYAVSNYMPTYMGAGLGGSTTGVQYATVLAAVFALPFYWIIGWLSDLKGRRTTVLITSVIMLVGFAGIFFNTGTSGYPGNIWTWNVFWWYALWTVGAGTIAIFGPWLSELFPVELRSSATSMIYMVGRTMSALSPVAVGAAAGGASGLHTGMTYGAIGMVFLIITACVLPETAGRKFDVIEEKDVGDMRS